MDAETLNAQLAALHRESFAWALTCCDRRADEAEDVLHAVYVKLLSGEVTFAGRSSFKTWLFAVIRNTATGAWRKRRRRAALLRAWFEREPAADREDAAQPAQVDAHRQADRVQEAVAALSQRQREVIELVFYHDLTLEEASEVLGAKLGTTRTHYARGKQRLAKLLTPAPEWAMEAIS